MKFLRFIETSDKNPYKINSLNNNSNIKTGYLKGDEVFELKRDILNYFNSNIKDIKKDIVNKYKIDDIKIVNPVSPSKIVCIGLNYKNHAKELNMKLPNTPKLFIKPSTSVIGTGEDIIKPEMSNEIDYEAELAIIIGEKSKNIEKDEAKKHIFGYTILNDVTARDIQRYDGQWTRGKSFDTFAPIGPVIETNLNPQNQKIKTKIIRKIKDENKISTVEEIRQESNTSNMVFSSYELVSFISKIMTLNPGDLIATGTPPGVGQIKPGEIVEIEIEDIGILSNKLVSY